LDDFYFFQYKKESFQMWGIR